MAMPLLYVTLFTLAVLLASYIMHRRIAPKPSKTSDKLAPYACGELLPPDRIPVRILLFKYMCLFLALDIIALLYAFTIGVPPPAAIPMFRIIVTVYGLSALAAVFVAVRG